MAFAARRAVELLTNNEGFAGGADAAKWGTRRISPTLAGESQGVLTAYPITPYTEAMSRANTVYRVAALLLQVPVLAAVLMFILVWSGVLPSREIRWLFVTVLHLSLLPLLYGAFVYQTQRISNADITERKERLVPFFVVTFVYGAYLLETIFFNAPVILQTIALNFFLTALLVSAITFVWKVSVHAAGVTQFIALLTLLLGNQAVFLFPLLIITGWLRIKMRSHDIWQVLGGIVVALVSALLATRINF